MVKPPTPQVAVSLLKQAKEMDGIRYETRCAAMAQLGQPLRPHVERERETNEMAFSLPCG
jgi:hypothetical protein